MIPLDAPIAPMDIYFMTINVKKLVMSVIMKIPVLLVIKLMNLERVVHLVILVFI